MHAKHCQNLTPMPPCTQRTIAMVSFNKRYTHKLNPLFSLHRVRTIWKSPLIFFRPLTKEYQEVAKSIFLTSSGTSSVMKNKSHKDYQEKVNGLWSNLKLFEKGLKQFEGILKSHSLLYLKG